MLLIRNADIHTMTDKGCVKGNLLISDGKILSIGVHIAEEDVTRTVDATGLHVYPGFIDMHMHLIRAVEDDDKNVRDICSDALASGVTTQALWPENSGWCRVYHGRDRAEVDGSVWMIRPEELTDAELAGELNKYQRIACEIDGERQLRRVLEHADGRGTKLILAHLRGCEGMLAQVAASGCAVVLGASAVRCGGGYAAAAALSAMGVRIALTSDYPATRLHHLPLCAGLCVRAGMNRDAAVSAITRGAAEILGLDGCCGSIRPGMRADLNRFDGDPLMLATARIMTVSGGVIEKES